MSNGLSMSKPGRWHIASRVFAAALPGYVLANSASIFLGLLLPVRKIESVATAALLSFAIYTAIIMWVFSVRRLSTVWYGLLGAVVLTSTGSWWLLNLENAA
ncbi:MAG: iron transporter [Pseudomonadota bacterium]